MKSLTAATASRMTNALKIGARDDEQARHHSR
jgi:hypothetical protein